jgi:uncharacterized membrane protein
MTIESSKTLGGIGAILLLFGIFPYINYFGIIELVGLILVFVALYQFGAYYNERGIFNFALYGVITTIVGVAAAIGIFLTVAWSSLTSLIQQLYPSWDGTWTGLSALSGMTPNTNAINVNTIINFAIAAIVVFVIAWVFAIISAYFYRRSLKLMSSKTTVGLFGTAGILLLIGAILLVVLIGAIIIWIGILVLAIAFFTIKPHQAPMAAAAATPPPSAPTPV